MLTAYTIDRDDRIVDVSPDWDSFACANDGPGACAAHVVGAPLYGAITGDPVRMYMNAIFMRVRASGETESIPYRCDSPAVRRLYRMTVEPLGQGRIRVTHDLERTDETGRVVEIRTARGRGRATPRCSVCCRVKDGEAWRDPFEDGRDHALRVVHTVCPACREAATRKRRAAGPREIFGAELLAARA